MNVIVKSALLVVVTLASFGCAQNYYNIPKDNYEQRVRVLGVAPVFVDADSDIRHPDKETLIALVKDYNRINEKKLVAMIKETGSHFDVRLLAGDADPLFASLLFRREKRDDAGVFYNKYFFKAEALRNYIKANNVDAVMLVVVSGITRPDKVHSANLIKYLATDYNFLIMTAMILDADGNILWEYPNFREKSTSFPPFVELQYPDFSESDANLNDAVNVKFKTIAGIRKTLEKQKKDLLQRDKQISDAYYEQFDEIVSKLGPAAKRFEGSKK
jgi:hypothetical protein